MKLRELLKKLRLRPLHADDEPSVDDEKLDALATPGAVTPMNLVSSSMTRGRTIER
jgi:hypothetical protein